MPGVSRAQRAEAKYNVVFDYPNLGLHSAAMSGNLGLVKYAIDHGQPVNSVLDGVLPIHAASFGGSDIAVKKLVEYGADVNATRLPRRYSTDKHRGSAPPLVITGASGSTSLHFAAMHGHAPVVLTLLMHGAHPDRMDKHGMTPEMVARQNGYNDCADVLQQWAHNKDRDLRERETLPSQSVDDQSTKDERSHAYCGSLECFICATRKRIRMKRSIDNAIHILRHSSSSTSAVATPLHSAGSISASNSVQPPSPTDRVLGKYTFYPSTDSALEDLPPRRPSLPDVFEVPRSASTAHRSRRPSNLSGTSSRRPRSAGSDADSNVGQRVKSKISLLNIFKRGNEGATDSPSSSSAVTSVSVSPAPASVLTMSTMTSRSSETLASNADSSLPISAGNQLHQRMLGDAVPSPLSSAELQHTASRDSLRGTHVLLSTDPFAKASPSTTRPGILRATHGRSSSGQSVHGDTPRSVSGTAASMRALRFDPASPGVVAGTRRPDSRVRHARAESRSPARSLVHGRGSLNSLRSHSPGSPWGMRMESEPEALHGAPAVHHGLNEEDEDGLYGQPRMHELQMRLSDLDSKARRLSVDSRASDLDSQDTISHRFECPFSINRPPLDDDEDADGAGELPVPVPARTSLDSRLRGNSMSSMVTDSSGGPPSSCVPTPALQHPNLPSPFVFSPSMGQSDLPSPGESPEKELAQASPSRRARGPLDIDIRQISSHAQAEALVQRAQRRILSMSDDSEEEGVKTFGLNLGEGHTPLSAKLAAYGESLAIERRFKAEEQRKRSSLVIDSPSDRTLVSHGGSVQRKLSLQEGAHGVPIAEARRPHTSDGDQPADQFLSPAPNVIDLSTSDPGRHSRLHRPLPASTASTPGAHYKTRSETAPLPVERPFAPRSRTPDPDASRPAALLGAPLTRFPTCPPEDTLIPRSDLLSRQERQAARAQKLAKMGFSSSGAAEPWKESPPYAARAQQRHQRFGGFKTLVQSLTGRV